MVLANPLPLQPEFALDEPERALWFFAETEANTVTDGLAAGSSLRECEQEPKKIELLERDKEPAPLKIVIPATTVNEDEDEQFDVGLGSEIGKSGEERSSVALEVFGEARTPISLRFEAGIGGSWEHGRDRCAAFSTSRTGSKCPPHLTFAEPTVSLIEVESDDSPEIQPILS